MYGNKLTMRQ